MCLFYRDKRSFEDNFPHQNWAIVLSFQLLISTIFSISGPSIYQFITSPRSLPEQLENIEDSERYWPGLGGTDTDYAWVQAAQPLFETGAVLVTVPLANHLPLSILLFCFVALASVGGGLYALAQSVWVAFLGRGLTGAGIQFGAATLHTYLGEMGTVMDKIRERQGKKPRKFTLYITLSFALNAGFAVPYALTTLMSRFRDVNPYRWPGWAVTILASLLGVLVILFFRETRSFSCKKVSGGLCSGLIGLKMSQQLRSKFKLRIFAYAFVIGCAYVGGKVYAILLAFITPVLDNKFGFNVKYTSLYLLGVSAGYITCFFIHLGAKIAKINNRVVLGMCLLFTVFGSLLIGDWQSIGHENNCRSFNTTHSSVEDSGSAELLGEYEPALFPISSVEDKNSSNTTKLSHYNRLVEGCESLSSADDTCYWNQQSLVTGQFCSICLPTCLSKRTTLNFYQFSVGVLLLSIAGPLTFVFVSAVASEITTVESQGAILSLMVGIGAFSRAVSPIWFIESYDLTGRHTYFSMAITAGCALVLLVSLVVLYKSLAPVTEPAGENYVIEATSKLSIMAENDIFSDNIEAGPLEIWTETPL